MESYALLLGSTLSAGTVLALAALGLLINEKSGIVNLGAEGMMLRCHCRFCRYRAHRQYLDGLWRGHAGGALLAAIFGGLVIWFNTNQYATGLALSLFGAGFSAFVGLGYVQAKLPELPKYSIPGLADLPLVGRPCSRCTRWSTAPSCWPP
jgi:simple sugar transport system permease protein